jgi:hypothetical protein
MAMNLESFRVDGPGVVDLVGYDERAASLL